MPPAKPREMLVMLTSVDQRLLGVAQQEPLAEIGERGALLEPVVRRRHRAARHAGNDVDAVDQRHRPAARANRAVGERRQNAVRERRGAHATARERQRDHGVVEMRLGFAAAAGSTLQRQRLERLVDRVVVDRTATAEQQRKNRRRANARAPLPLRKHDRRPVTRRYDLTPNHVLHANDAPKRYSRLRTGRAVRYRQQLAPIGPLRLCSVPNLAKTSFRAVENPLAVELSRQTRLTPATFSPNADSACVPLSAAVREPPPGRRTRPWPPCP